MAFLETVLSPIIWVMGAILSVIHSLTDSVGLAIIGLSICVRLAMIPVVRIAVRAEAKERDVLSAMAPELALARQETTGRERFERIDEIYQRHGYHPIKSVVSLLPIFLQLPFLLSALFLLLDHPALQGQGFLFIQDLAAPDRLLPFGPFAVNFLPLLIAGISVLESLAKPGQTTSSKMRFLVVMLVVAVLIYPLPAGVCLYWLTSSAWSLGSTILGRLRAQQD